MTLKTKPFNQMFSFSRAGGATRVNAAGLIVGVDFSPTSNTIGTGSKTFTLTADANVNRDWAVGSSVIAVSQAGATGSMTGTVTSYNASTQELVINVTSITGSGTSTNWRIGSLEFRRDFDPVTLAPRGGLVEGQATNGFPSSDGVQASFVSFNNVAMASTPISGFTNSVQFGDNSALRIAYKSFTPVSGAIYALSVFVQMDDNGAPVVSQSNDSGDFSLVICTERASPLSVTSVGGNVYRVSALLAATTNGSHGVVKYTTQSSRGFRVTGFQIEAGSVATSYIPTTTVAVTRAADLANIDGSRFSQAYNQSQGTLYVEMTPTAAAVQAVAASINDGTLNNAIRIGQKQSGTLSSIRAIASDGVTDVMALNTTASNTLRSNGIDYAEVSTAAIAAFAAASSGVGNFLVTGGSDSLLSTADGGQTFVGRSVNGSFGGAHFGIGRFVIAGPTSVIQGVTLGQVIVSTDGITFRRVNIPGLTQQLQEITSNGTNQYVAVGNGGVIYTSPDAETWTARTSGTGGNINGVTFGNALYVASANNGVLAILTSPDGITWTTRSTPNSNYLDVAYNGTNLYVAVGTSGTIITSPDGITWTQRTSPVTQNLNGVHFADGLWVAVGNAGTVVTSPDGITWTDRTATSGNTQNNTEVYFFSGFWYNIGASGLVRRITTTDLTNNVTWSAVTLPALAGALIGIVANGTRLLVCGTNGAIVTSDDGTTFTSRTGNNAILNGAAFGNGTYVVVGNAVNGSGLIATVDPATFAYTRRVSGTIQSINCVIANNGRFIAAGNDAAGVNQIVYSDNNGVSWTLAAVGAGGYVIRGIAAIGETVVGVGNGGRVIVSANNGASFAASQLSGATTNNLFGISSANGLFVAVGGAGTIITSPNGTAWTLRTSGTTVTLYAVHWSTRDQCFYAAGDSGVILRSADGITWENIANDAIGAVIRNGSIQSNPQLQNLVVGIPNKVAMRIKENDFAISVNGSDPFKDTSGTVPSANRISLGMSGVQTFPFNGHIRKLNYYPGVMPDSELKEITGL